MCQGSISPTGRRIQGTPLAAKPAPTPAKKKAPAGWYDDPTMVNTRRYWDGQKWTEHRQEATAPDVAAPTWTPPAAAPEPARGKGCATAFGIAASIVVVLVVIGVMGGQGGSEGNEIGAEIACKDFVKDQLKAPATADFDNMLIAAGSERTSSGADPSFEVQGDVDSENGFGAKIRNHFSCEVHYTESDETWHLDDINVTNR